VTIYTTNCDEKILIDALVSYAVDFDAPTWLILFQKSLNLDPNREIISAFFNRSKPSTAGTTKNCELNLVDYIIYRSKLNCNYMKLIELIRKSCKIDNDDEYGDKKFDINFYPVSWRWEFEYQ
jgi:hypothetical protein